MKMNKKWISLVVFALGLFIFFGTDTVLAETGVIDDVVDSVLKDQTNQEVIKHQAKEKVKELTSEEVELLVNGLEEKGSLTKEEKLTLDAGKKRLEGDRIDEIMLTFLLCLFITLPFAALLSQLY